MHDNTLGRNTKSGIAQQSIILGPTTNFASTVFNEFEQHPESVDLSFENSLIRSLENASDLEDSCDCILVSSMASDLYRHKTAHTLRQTICDNTKPIVVVGGTIKSDYREYFYNLGMNDVICDSISPQEAGIRILNQIDRFMAHKRAITLSFKDELTNLLNRRGYNNALEREWTRCKKSNQPLSLLIVDIDFFKRFNDSHGHLKGDALLQRVSHQLKSICNRTIDVVARYGGDEFAILLPEMDPHKANDVARELVQLNNIGDVINVNSSAQWKFTYSIGVATVNPTNINSALKLFSAADQALYMSKAKGKNCWTSLNLDNRQF